jgi:hypothetical protein
MKYLNVSITFHRIRIDGGQTQYAFRGEPFGTLIPVSIGKEDSFFSSPLTLTRSVSLFAARRESSVRKDRASKEHLLIGGSLKIVRQNGTKKLPMMGIFLTKWC